MTERLYQITASHFCAGITINDRGQVTHAAPIVAYMHGWTERRVMNYVRQKAWRIVEVQPQPAGEEAG
jgi:hypothetical protein